MSEILEGLPVILCHIDDVLIFGKDSEEHDLRLYAALKEIQEEWVTHNRDKCQFNKSNITFLGRVIDSNNGISPDPRKTKPLAKGSLFSH